MIRKGNKMLQVSVPEKVIDSMNKLCAAYTEKLGMRYTKGMLVTIVYLNWLEQAANDLKKISEEIAKEEKKDA